MSFPIRIQPIDGRGMELSDLEKSVPKSRLKRLFEQQFPGVLRTSSAERIASSGTDLEPSSICLDKMVRNFMEDNGEKPSSQCGCNCFHGNCNDISDDDLDTLSSNASETPTNSAAELIKGLVVCSTLEERNLLADASIIVDKSKNFMRSDEHIKAVGDGLRSLGYDASICRSRWDKTASFPAGEHEYIDVIIAGERLLVDVDFRSEFQIARSTKVYTAVLQSLPPVFVGKEDRVGQIVAVVSEAARLSLNKKGLHFPPWRKPEYMRSKWLAPYERYASRQEYMRSKWLAPYERYAVASDAKQAALDVEEETSGTVALAEEYSARRLGRGRRRRRRLRWFGNRRR